jgi:hypothetical protein
MKVENKKIITLDSNLPDLSDIEAKLEEQNTRLQDQLISTQKILQQSKIHNLYKAHENDFTVDETIFDTGDDV